MFLKYTNLAIILGFNDIRTRYLRSVIGPFWLTISTAVLISCIGIIFGKFFNSSDDYFLHLGVGIIFWSFISSTIKDGCHAFVGAKGMIKQISLPFFVYIMRVLWRNILVLLHNILILPFLFILLGKNISTSILLFFPGFVLILIGLSFVSFFFAILCARYGDLSQLISTILQIFFYVTPIIWMPNLLTGRVSNSILELNPFYHILEIIRKPILGEEAELNSWLIVGLISLIGWLITFWLYNRVKNQIVYWL